MCTTKVSGIRKQDIFELIGSYGPWQQRIFILLFMVNVIGVWQNFAVTFLAPNMEYWCVSPPHAMMAQRLMKNYSIQHGVNDTNHPFPMTSRTVDQCNIPIAINVSEEGISEEGVKTEIVKCVRWEYDRSFYQQTIVSEWDLVCEREWLVSFTKSIYMVGFLISVIMFGQLADWVGRFPTMVICYVITVISGFLSVFSPSYVMFVILRFFQAFGRTGLTTTGYVLLMEVVGPGKRTLLGIAIQLGWSIGMVTLPALAWFVRGWWWLQLAMAIPLLPLASMYWLIPESPRWLMTQGKKKQLEAVVLKAAKLNRRTLKHSVDVLLPLEISKDQTSEKNTKGILDLVKTPQMRKRVCNMAFLWVVNAFVYYSLAYNTNDLGGDPYLNFFLSGLLEFPSYLAVYYSIRKIGRRMSIIIGMLVGGVSCAAIMAVPQDLLWLSVTFSMIGKFFVTGTFGLLYLYTTELFPTVVRNTALGACSMCARVGSIVAPFARELGKSTHHTVPNAVNAALAIISGLLAFLLPETKDKKIPDTIEEGENMYDDDDAEKQHDGVSKHR